MRQVSTELFNSELFNSKLLLFISLDLTGSTAFKQGQKLYPENNTSSSNSNRGWFHPIYVFYQTVKNEFDLQWNKLNKIPNLFVCWIACRKWYQRLT